MKESQSIFSLPQYLHSVTTAPAFIGLPVLDTLERILNGGSRHREEMARIRMAEKEMEEEYQLKHRRLDAAFHYAMAQLEERRRLLELHFESQMQALAVDSKESGHIQTILQQTMQLATDDSVPSEVRIAAMDALPRLTISLNTRQAERHRYLNESQQIAILATQLHVFNHFLQHKGDEL